MDGFQGAYAFFLERNASEVVVVEGREGDVDVAEKACVLRSDVVEKQGGNHTVKESNYSVQLTVRYVVVEENGF